MKATTGTSFLLRTPPLPPPRAPPPLPLPLPPPPRPKPRQRASPKRKRREPNQCWTATPAPTLRMLVPVLAPIPVSCATDSRTKHSQRVLPFSHQRPRRNQKANITSLLPFLLTLLILPPTPPIAPVLPLPPGRTTLPPGRATLPQPM